MFKFLLSIFPLLILGCSSSSSEESRTLAYPYSTNYDTSNEATKQNPLLVIRLDYANQQFVNDETTWANKIFGTQTSQLNDYMNEVSNGQFQYTPVAEGGGANDGVVTVLFSSDHPNPSNIDDDSTFHPDLKEAIEAVSNYGFDFSLYDDNNDGAISPDELLIVFIMAGEEDAFNGGSSDNGIWAHQYCTTATYTPNVNGMNVMGCSSGGNFAIFGERHCYSSNNCHDATIGIIAHELGHAALSLPDLYYGSATRIGYYGIMSVGSWGQVGGSGEPGDTPTHFCAWSKLAADLYTNPIVVENAQNTYTVNATGTAGYNIYKVPLNASNTEYFLVENRGVNSYDAGLKFVNNNFTGGVAIWHIDEQVIIAKTPTNSVNSNAAHKGVDIEEATGPNVDIGNGDPVQNLYYSSNVNAFTTSTTPNTNDYNDLSSGIVMSNISPISETMTLDINNPN